MANFNEKNFKTDSAQGVDIKQSLAEGEQVLWSGKPNRKAYILGRVLRMMPIALVWLLFDGAFIGLMIGFDVFGELPPVFIVVIVVFFIVHLIPVWIWISNIVTAGIQHKNTEYLVTDKRIIVKTGVIGVNVTNLYYVDISNVNLKVGITDRMLRVGDIYISGRFKAQVLWDIENPYEVTAKLQKIINDIKTDMLYPNELRPDVNRGYGTRYNGGNEDFFSNREE